MDFRLFTYLTLLSGIQAANWIAMSNNNGKAKIPDSAALAGYDGGNNGLYVGR